MGSGDDTLPSSYADLTPYPLCLLFGLIKIITRGPVVSSGLARQSSGRFRMSSTAEMKRSSEGRPGERKG